MSTPAAARTSAKRPRNDRGDDAAETSQAEDARPAKQQHLETEEQEQDAAWQTMYAPLPSSLQPDSDRSKILTASASASSSSAAAAAASLVGAPTNSYIPGLIASLVPPGQFVTNYNSKLKEKNLMLDNSIAAKNVALNIGEASAKLEKKRRKKRGIQMMSSNQRKAKGLTQIPKQEIKYAHFLPLHHLWTAYMHDILDPLNSRGLSTGERILKADFHGAIFTVIRARSPTHIGLRGIMVQETQETFQIVTETNALKILPKRSTIFSFTVPAANPAGTRNDNPSATPSPSPSPSSSPSPNTFSTLQPHIFELYGDHMCFRSYERSSRKFKAKATIQL